MFGAICVFPQEEDNLFWILEHLTRRIQLLDNESQEQNPKTSMDHTPHAGHSGSSIFGELRWGIMSTFPLPMPVMYNAQIFPRFFTTDKELGLAYLPLDEQIQALLENRTFFLQGSLFF